MLPLNSPRDERCWRADFGGDRFCEAGVDVVTMWWDRLNYSAMAHQTYRNKLSDKGFSLSLCHVYKAFWLCGSFFLSLLLLFLSLYLFISQLDSTQLISIAFLYNTQKPHKRSLTVRFFRTYSFHESDWKKGKKRNPLLSMATAIETQYTAINLKKHFFTSIDYLNLPLFMLSRASSLRKHLQFEHPIEKFCGKKIHGEFGVFEESEFDKHIYMFIWSRIFHRGAHTFDQHWKPKPKPNPFVVTFHKSQPRKSKNDKCLHCGFGVHHQRHNSQEVTYVPAIEGGRRGCERCLVGHCMHNVEHKSKYLSGR